MTATTRSPERLLEGLNDAQREAAAITRGPLAILAGAGSGKTRVISHRAAYAIETGAVPSDRILLVTFTERAAGEMAARMATLGHPGVMARTFHAAALAQLRHFWPSRHAGDPLPRILDSKTAILFPLVAKLPGGYRFTALKDLADVIEWAKVRRIRPARWPADGGERAPIPADLFARLYADYERAKSKAGQIDFEDMLVETVELLERDEEAATLVRSRKTWLSIDEYQDTNPLAERLTELWLGDSQDIAVVGDPDQTIYTFTGASPEFLLRFAERHRGARIVSLVDNYRSTPQILALANRLVAPGPRGTLRATREAGPKPAIRRYPHGDAELDGLVDGIRGRLASGTEPGEIAVLVRINAQLPELEQALTRAAIPFRVRGQRFFERREVRDARRLLARSHASTTGPALAGEARALFERRLGLGAGDDQAGPEARERSAALELLLGVIDDLASADPDLTWDAVTAELDRRDAEEAAGSTNGVNLLTYHRAKGLEWDAVFLPALEEGLLPVRQAKDADAVAEERRLLYVGITRARFHLALSWAQSRTAPGGKAGRRDPSRFLADLDARPPGDLRAGRDRGRPAPDRTVSRARVAAILAQAEAQGREGQGVPADRRCLEGLQRWRRERAKADGVPAYVVAPDATLVAIAEARPRTEHALASVRGIGPARLEQYGAEILAIVARES